MKKIISLLLTMVSFAISVAQHTPPRPPRPGKLPPRLSHRVPPRPKSPDAVIRDIDRTLRSRPEPPRPGSQKIVKSSNGKHNGAYKKPRLKKRPVRHR